MSEGFEQKTVVVTGGTGALGSAVTRRLLDAGANVHVTWVDPDEKLGSALTDHSRVQLHRVDCTDEQQVADFFERFDDLWASLHIAGGFGMGPIEKQTLEDFHGMMRINAATCFLCCREAAAAMRRSGGGRIVNVTARPAQQLVANLASYSASKAAVASLTGTLAEELKEDGILVNAVSPSIMDTPANRAGMPNADHDRWPKVEQVAEAVAFLASPANELASGALLPVYGRV